MASLPMEGIDGQGHIVELDEFTVVDRLCARGPGENEFREIVGQEDQVVVRPLARQDHGVDAGISPDLVVAEARVKDIVPAAPVHEVVPYPAHVTEKDIVPLAAPDGHPLDLRQEGTGAGPADL